MKCEGSFLMPTVKRLLSQFGHLHRTRSKRLPTAPSNVHPATSNNTNKVLGHCESIRFVAFQFRVSHFPSHRPNHPEAENLSPPRAVTRTCAPFVSDPRRRGGCWMGEEMLVCLQRRLHGDSYATLPPALISSGCCVSITAKYCMEKKIVMGTDKVRKCSQMWLKICWRSLEVVFRCIHIALVLHLHVSGRNVHIYSCTTFFFLNFRVEQLIQMLLKMSDLWPLVKSVQIVLSQLFHLQQIQIVSLMGTKSAHFKIFCFLSFRTGVKNFSLYIYI